MFWWLVKRGAVKLRPLNADIFPLNGSDENPKLEFCKKKLFENK